MSLLDEKKKPLITQTKETDTRLKDKFTQTKQKAAF